MSSKNLFYTIILFGLLWSCGKEESPEPTKNIAPKIAAQTFNVAENISDDVIIGDVKATDDDQDDLTFNISTNDNNLFEISSSGSLSLASGKSLDFSVKAQHHIVVTVSDGEDEANGNITINVTEIAAVNQSPELEPQNFEAFEDISDTDIIGTVEATDADGDNFTYSIAENDEELFEIDENTGELSLIQGRNLDFELSHEHTITILVTDGTSTSEASVTIVVGNIADSLAEDSTSFVTKWKTETANEEIIVGTNDELDLVYDYTIDWGDGTIEDLTEGNPSHIYGNPGTYTVAINGQFPTIRIDKDLFDFEPVTTLISIEQWGTIQWQNLESAFHNCENMEYNAVDAPDLSQLTSLWNMFRSASKFSGADFSNWDVSTITNMIAVFSGTKSNLLNVSQWDVSNVTNMGNMFHLTDFNGDITEWTVSSVEDMSGMFAATTSFNQDISVWNVSNVSRMYLMFLEADSFDKNLGNWNISSLEPGPTTGFGSAFDYSSMSPENLSATLIGWANNPNTALGIVCGIEGLSMCDNNEAIEAFAKLAADLQWQFSSYPDLIECQ